MEQLIFGTHHISLKPCGVKAFEETLHFYHDILGMPFVRRWGEGTEAGAMLSTGNSLMEINISSDAVKTGGSIRHFALTVKDVDKVIQAVRQAGYEITMEPKDVEIPAEPPFPICVAFCKGPCGEEVEFFLER